MHSRQVIILKELIGSDVSLTSQTLAHILDVSSRTVRDDIKELDQTLTNNGATITSTRGKGYTLTIQDDASFRHFLKNHVYEQHANDFSQPDQRVAYLIERFLLAESHIKTDDLMDEMHVSRSTIQNDLRQVKEQLNSYKLTLLHKPNYGMKLVGSEVKRRFALSQFIFDQRDVRETMVWKKQLTELTHVTEQQIQSLWALLIDTTKRHHISLSDIALNNLFIHMAIAYKRIKDGHEIDFLQHDLTDIQAEHEYTVAEEVVKKSEHILNITFPETEVCYIAIHLLGTKIVTHRHQTEEDLKQWLPSDIVIVTERMLQMIEDKLSLSIQHDRELILGLGLHLKPAMNRFKYGMNVRNPMLEDIKTSYPLAFEAGIIAGVALEETLDVSIDENEIGYLALHIGAAIERQKLKHKPLSCFIVCASGLGSAQLIKYKLQSMFGSKINILGTTEFYKIDQLPFNAIDLIISSVPIQQDLPVPVVEVNAILTDQDINQVETYFKADYKELLQYIDQHAIFLKQSLDTKEAALSFLYKQLKAPLQLPNDYLIHVFEREKIAPTAYGNLIAIPHPITAQTKETHVSMMTLDKPIEWGDKRVQFIILLNVSKDSQEDLQSLYSFITKLVENKKHIQRLIQIDTLPAFIDQLFSIGL
ncbi:putative licABCH operon regulator [Halolactibacillus miurensis]|uniref:LicABCH operon regulator n=1 Tax=Halolactibacillus miurensis TaxID=306541 RepID=A0A1I6PBG6_9BACI|nr:BglG family transcription antiterminator [Halolactibacillus miurensis]GEM05298.1 putative licABCH operon regulator [Halolactibacillus miurensis]SFS37480.1 lichenan operon transcriptional antiterminator [Halolactibacillus miurensis]